MARAKNTTRLEKGEQLAIRDLMKTLGAAEYVLGTVRRKGDHPGTMQTPGLPDLQFFLPEKRVEMKLYRTRRFVVVEAKRAKGGRFSSEQIEYRGLALAAGIDYIGGSLDDVIAWLIAEGYLSANQVPHYRLPAAVTA